jgi:hypothetical protein
MLRFVSLAISRTGGMTEVTRLIIGKEFLISPALVNVIASWVMSCEVDDDKLTDDQRRATPPDSWLHHAEQLVPPGWLQEVQQRMANNPALGPNQGAAYEAELEEPYQHRVALPHQTVTMGCSHPTTTHMESKKGG